jgi:RNA exonuclease 1
MADQAYPTPSALPDALSTDPNATFTFEDWQRADGWVEAPYLAERPDAPKRVLGIDCEMVSAMRSLSIDFQFNHS